MALAPKGIPSEPHRDSHRAISYMALSGCQNKRGFAVTLSVALLRSGVILAGKH